MCVAADGNVLVTALQVPPRRASVQQTSRRWCRVCANIWPSPSPEHCGLQFHRNKIMRPRRTTAPAAGGRLQVQGFVDRSALVAAWLQQPGTTVCWISRATR